MITKIHSQIRVNAAQQPRAGDAAGAARHPWRSRVCLACRHSWRSRNLPAAHLTRIVGPLASRYAVAGQTEQPERSRITTHRWVSPDITGHNRAYPGIFRHFRTRKNHRVPSCPSPVMPSHTACRVRYDLSLDRVPSGSSHAVSFVVGHGVEKGHRVPYRPSPDRVPYGPSRAG